jgi:streptomycin 6-kinase
VLLPDGLGWWRDVPGGAEWLRGLPDLAEACAADWGLTLDEPFGSAYASLAVPAVTADGTRVVLKLNPADRESDHEADALAVWDGDAAARLLAHDPARRALLIERLDPGDPLWTVPDEDEANRIAAGLLRRLWRPPPEHHPFRRLADDAAWWAGYLVPRFEALGRPFERSLLDRAVRSAAELSARPPDEVVLHQDLHGGNILRAGREPWLVIDPKPLVGERAFDLASLLRDRRSDLARDPWPSRRLRRRLDMLSSEVGVDRERARGWGVVHALAWGVTTSAVDPHLLRAARGLAAA